MNGFGRRRARAAVSTFRKNGNGHAFVAENRGGKVVFVDLQTANSDVAYYFKHAKAGYTLLHRMDDLVFTELIKDCYEDVGK